MRLKKKLTLMRPSELRKYRDARILKMCNYRAHLVPHSFRWNRSLRIIGRIEKEIRFKEMLIDSLDILKDMRK